MLLTMAEFHLRKPFYHLRVVRILLTRSCPGGQVKLCKKSLFWQYLQSNGYQTVPDGQLTTHWWVCPPVITLEPRGSW